MFTGAVVGLLLLPCFVFVRLRLFTPCVLESGNKSYSHVIALLERYKSVFTSLCQTTVKKLPPKADAAADASDEFVPLTPFECQRLILHSLSEYWQHSIQHIIVIIEQMFNVGILSIQSIIAWTFFAQKQPTFQVHLWKNILLLLVRKALVQIDADIEALRQKPSMALNANSRAEDDQAIESKRAERADVLLSCLKNFQRLLADVQSRPSVNDKDRDRKQKEQDSIISRVVQFIREFYAELAPLRGDIEQALPSNSPLAELIPQIELLR
jgi:hypothetical protein